MEISKEASNVELNGGEIDKYIVYSLICITPHNVALLHLYQFNPIKKLALWSDWYTIYKAKKVYHTESGFSESACHASGISGRRFKILGTEKGLLKLESCWHDPVTKLTGGCKEFLWGMEAAGASPAR